MSSDIIVAIIGFAGVILAQLIISKASAKDLYAKLDKQSELSDAKIHGEIDVLKQEVASLKEETRKHNGMIERTYRLEERMSVQEEKQKVNQNRLTDLERKVG